tara:strand:+ start:8863 stop:9003 length:141 start_codon:yes stop_codon:yes gene_type:complete
MLKNILDLLPLIGDTDSLTIQIAKGKYKYPETFKDLKRALKTIKEK